MVNRIRAHSVVVKSGLTLGLITGVMLGMGAPVLAGPDWVEGKTDAGSTFLTAQRTFGTGQLTTITGALSAPSAFAGGAADYEDLFLVTITDPSKFSMTVANADFDAQIWVFNVTLPGQLFGLLANNDTRMGNMPVIGPFATDGSGAALTLPGVYAIAISGAGRFPISNGGAIFNFGSPTEISGPDGPGGFLPLSGWSGVGEVGSYVLELEGTGFFDVPGPGGLALLALGALFGGRRRRA